jgi:2-oxoacid:acceptor oxidoreductase delta subunit (pyruvate/2-ketoisovalerate family)
MRPTLRNRDATWGLCEYPDNTSYEAGFLTQKNAGWRSERPVIDADRGTGCLQCYLYCPDGVISWADEKRMDIDYDFCKGCGICAKICRVGAIVMEAELR